MKWCKAAKRLRPKEHRALPDPIMPWALERVTDGLFVDGGACVGVFCIPILLQRPEATCIAFEPGGMQYRALCEMAEMNGVSDRLKAHPWALYSDSRVLELKIPANHKASGLSTVGTPKRFSKWTTEQVLSVKLDTLNIAPQLIKLDLEGAELFALRGAESTLVEHSPPLVVEAQGCNTKQHGYRVTATKQFIQSLGYSCVKHGADYYCEVNDG